MKPSTYYMLVQLSDELSPFGSQGKHRVPCIFDENLTIIEADLKKLARVFNNILKNAASYKASHTEIVISGQMSKLNMKSSFEQNSGEDIPNEALASLFQ